MRWKAVVFDLDGTLVDSLEDLADSVNAALATLGYPAHPLAAYRYFVGDGMRMLASRVLPDASDGAAVDRLQAVAEEEYQQRWQTKTRPYAGIAKLLDFLSRHRIPSAVLSNKPDAFTQKVVAAVLADWHFAAVHGVTSVRPRKPDPEGALAIAAELGLKPKDMLYLGDTNTDMQTARRAGMHAVGAVWGFRTRDELLTSGAQSLAEHPADVIALLQAGMP